MARLWLATLFSLLLFSSLSFSQTQSGKGFVAVSKTDGTSACYGWELMTSSAPTDNGNGTCTISSSGGGTGNVGIGTTQRIAQYIGTTTIGSPANDVIDSNGNIGIGSASPGQTLDVQGTVRMSGTLQVGSSNLDTATFNSSTGGVTINGLFSEVGGIDSFTKLMLHLDNNVTDSENTPKIVTNNSVTFSNSVFQFGGFSAIFNGTTGYLSTPNSSDFNFPADFTVSFWMYPAALSGTRVIMGNVDYNVPSGAWGIDFADSTHLEFYSPGNFDVQGLHGMSTNTWYNVEVDRCSSSINLYVNGTSIASTSSAVSLTSTKELDIGRNSTTSLYYYQGNLDEIKIDNGVCRHSGSFTPALGPFASAATIASLTFDSVGTPLYQYQANSMTPSLSLLNSSGNPIQTIIGNNIGIGSTVPGQILDVIGTVRATNFSGNGSALTQLAASPTNSIQYNSGGNLTGSSGLTYTGTNVGIGSTVPGQVLDVQGTIRSTQMRDTGVTASKVVVTDTNQQFVAASNVQDLAYCQTGGTNCPGSITGFANPSATVGTAAVNGSAATAMRSDGAPAINLTMSPTWTGNHTFSPSTGNTTFSTGNVGIGSTVPGDILDVQGTLRVTGLTGGVSALYIPTGNIGVGSLTPGQKLDVNGTVRATALIKLGGTSSQFLKADGSVDSTSYGTGTVTAVSVASANGFTGSSSGGATPSLTLTTSISGPLEGNGTAISAATAANIVGLFTSCSGTQYLGADAACHNAGGSASAAGGTNAVQYNSGSSTFAGQENKVSINSNGNLGIGTTSGKALLDVQGTVSLTGVANGVGTLLIPTGNLGINSATPGQMLDVKGTVRGIGEIINGNVGIGTSTINQGSLVVTNGNVGIGTWAPADALIVMNGNIGVGVNNPGAPFTVSAAHQQLASFTSTNDPAPYFIVQGNDSAGIIIGESNGGNGIIQSHTTANSIQAQTNGGILGMFEAGNTGINTTTPQTALSVYGNVGIGTVTATGGSLIVATGNVGIGSITPGSKLDVQGTVRGISGGTCTTLYRCQGGADAGIIQTVSCVLCPTSTCVAMNGCF